MSNYRNEDGEYLMTAAEIALEDALDAQSRDEALEDQWYYEDYEPEEKSVDECNHSDGSYPGEVAGFTCEAGCYTEFVGPHMGPAPDAPSWMPASGFFTYDWDNDDETDRYVSQREMSIEEDAYIDACDESLDLDYGNEGGGFDGQYDTP